MVNYSSVLFCSLLVLLFANESAAFNSIFKNQILAVDIPYLLVEDPPGSGQYVKQNLSDASIENFPINDEDITYHFYSRDNNGTEINENNVSNISFNSSKQTIFIISGWMSSYDDSNPQMVKDAYLQTRDVNVIIVDWSTISKKTYVTAKYFIRYVGVVIARFIQFMADIVGLEMDKLGLVGHSLGAHICGVVGYNLNGTADRIIGLDPAGPLFYLTGDFDKLDPSDAQFVEVIHTCAGLLGYPYALGDADYWPNGGYPPQPGCLLDITGICSHDRAYRYYIESLVTGGFKSSSCMNYLAYSLNFCDKDEKQAYMGNDAIDRSTGNFYLTTNSNPPYSKS